MASTAWAAVGDPQPAKITEMDAQFHAMAGEMAAGRAMPETAAEEFLKALDYSPNAEMAARATGYALAANREDLALLAANKWLSADSSAMDAREVIARVSLKNGAVAEAMAQCLAMVRGHPGGESEGLRHVALVLSQDRAQATAALGLMKSLVAKWPLLAASHRALALLAFRFDDVALAEKSAREAMKLSPNDREASLLLVGAQVKRGDLAAADANFESLIAQQKDVAELRLGYARLLIDGNQRPQAKQQLERVLKAAPSNGDAHFALALLLLDENKLPEAESHLTVLLSQADRQGDAAYYLGRIAEQRKQFPLALTWYERVNGGTQPLEAFMHRARMLSRLGRLTEAREILSGLRDQYPPLATRLLETEADILAEQNDLTSALALYDAAVKKTPDDSNLLYGRSMLHEKMKRIDLAEKDLRQSIALNADDGRALNALGYLLSNVPLRVDEASKLIARAFALTPDDPAVLDSWGWVQVKQGKVAEGLPFLKRAYESFPDAEVAAHIGEAMWLLGDKAGARAIWDAAAREDANHKVLRETMQRFLVSK